MEYKIVSVTGSFPSKYPDSKKYEFLVERNPNKLSAFSKFPMEVGQVISGEIIQNGQWYNFKFASKGSTSHQDNDKLEKAIIRLEMAIGLLIRKVDALVGTPKPPMSGSSTGATTGSSSRTYPVNTDEPPFPDEF